jgi:hypothetical protein
MHYLYLVYSFTIPLHVSDLLNWREQGIFRKKENTTAIVMVLVTPFQI